MLLQGVWCALLTPLDAERRFDSQAMTDLIEQLLAEGITGVVPLGTTGEFTEFERDEREEIVECVVDVVRDRVPVLAGVGGISTGETCENARRAEVLGASGVLVLPPLYWKPDRAGIVRHYLSVANATSLPMVLYAYPALSGIELPRKLVGAVMRETSSVAGIKMSVRDIFDIMEMLRSGDGCGQDVRVVTGFEDLLPGTIWAGGVGAISGLANLCAPLLVQLYDALISNDETCWYAYAKMMKLFEIYRMSNPPILALKAAAQALGMPVRANSRIKYNDSDAIITRAIQFAKRWQVEYSERMPEGGRVEC